MNVQLSRSFQGVPAQKKLRRGLLFGLASLGVSTAALILALEYKPAWYAPPLPSESELREGRMEAMRIVDDVGDRLVTGVPFDVELSQAQVNVWLSGLEQIWPEASQRIPDEVRQPYVSFEPDSIRSAARVEAEGWRAIASCVYQLALSNDKKLLTARLQAARCGAVPLPQFVIATFLKSPSTMRSQREPWYEYLEWDNYFVWPNGRRPFRIERIDLEHGFIRIRIVPL